MKGDILSYSREKHRSSFAIRVASTIAGIVLLVGASMFFASIGPRQNERAFRLDAQYEVYLRGLWIAMQSYEMDHGGQPPNSLADLRSEGYVDLGGSAFVVNTSAQLRHSLVRLPPSTWNEYHYVKPTAASTGKHTPLIYRWLSASDVSAGADVYVLFQDRQSDIVSRDELQELLKQTTTAPATEGTETGPSGHR